MRLDVLANLRATRYSPELSTWLDPLRERFEVRLIEVDDPARFAEHLRRSAERSDAIAIASGDGTLARNAPLLIECGLPVGVIPLGNANDLARGLGLPLDGRMACLRLANALPIAIDVGRVNGHHFFSGATIGLGTRVSAAMEATSKRRWRRLSYLPRIWAAFRDRRGLTVRIRTEAGQRRWRSIHLTVSNGRTLGGGLVTDQMAHLRDGTLSIASVRPLPMAKLIALAPWLLTGRRRDHAEIDALDARCLRVETHRPAGVATDGDVVTRTPAVFDLAPRAVRFFVPRVPEPSLAVSPPIEQGEAASSAMRPIEPGGAASFATPPSLLATQEVEPR